MARDSSRYGRDLRTRTCINELGPWGRRKAKVSIVSGSTNTHIYVYEQHMRSNLDHHMIPPMEWQWRPPCSTLRSPRSLKRMQALLKSIWSLDLLNNYQHRQNTRIQPLMLPKSPRLHHQLRFKKLLQIPALKVMSGDKVDSQDDSEGKETSCRLGDNWSQG